MKKYIPIITTFFIVAMVGCKKNYLDQEVNPNSPSVTTPQYTLSGAQETTAVILEADYTEFGVWAGYWCNSGSYTPNPQLAEFAISTTQYPGPDVWSDTYGNLTNYNNLQTLSTPIAADANFEAIAMIMKAYEFQQLVDLFNNVPYSQAFQPATILFPAYDDGQTVYNDLVKQLDAAIALINKSTAATNPGSSDIIYGGNMTNWKKFANTVKLRMAIRQSGLGTNAAEADLASTASEGYIDASSEADANPGYTDAVGKQNPFYSNYGFDANNNPGGGAVYYRANEVAIGIMNKLSDPRVGYYYSTVPTSATDATPTIRGNQLGNAGNESNSLTSAIGAGLAQSSTQNSVILSAYESYFLQAEAVARGWITGSAATLYNEGITASFTAVGAPGAAAYEALGAVAYPTAAVAPLTLLQTQVQAIITQKYISLNGYFNLEAYLEFLRTGYPALPQNPASADNAATSQTLPVRLPYPLEELDTNPTNFSKQGTINPFTSYIFWDTRNN